MTEHVLILADQADWYCERLAAASPGFLFHPAANLEQALARGSNAAIVMGFAPYLTDELLSAMPRLKWVHALTTGVDNLLGSSALRPEVFLTNSKGFHGPQMSELAILLMLSSVRRFPDMLTNQRERAWAPWPQPLLQGKTACIIGLGAIAEELATRLLAFGMRLSGVSDGRSQAPGFECIFPRREIRAAVSAADFLIVLVPYSEKTHHIVDDEVMRSMRPDAVLVNLARGGCVDEVALERHLRAGTIRAAALDVFAKEPLPAESSLWDTPNLTITPHVGGRSDIYREQVLPGIVRNLIAWRNGGGNALPDLVVRAGR